MKNTVVLVLTLVRGNLEKQSPPNRLRLSLYKDVDGEHGLLFNERYIMVVP